MDETLRNAQILVVDDQDANVMLLEQILRTKGYTRVTGVTDSRSVVSLFLECRPDLILLDLHMPHLDGFAVMERLQPLIDGGTYLPILVLSADITQAGRQRALSMGAKDFVTKPFDATEVLLRIRNLLETRFLHLRLQGDNQLLEDRVRERTKDLEEARLEILERLAVAAEFRDDSTGQHIRRVGESSALIAQTVGLDSAAVELIRRAAPLHDVGKIGIPDRILLKPGRLTPEEMEVMKTHTTIGGVILSGSRSPLLQLAESIALTHHEHIDGTGYPRGLKGEVIPLAGRIVAVADAFDAMTSDRPYRKALTLDQTRAILRAGAGKQWDGELITALGGATADHPHVRV